MLSHLFTNKGGYRRPEKSRKWESLFFSACFSVHVFLCVHLRLSGWLPVYFWLCLVDCLSLFPFLSLSSSIFESVVWNRADIAHILQYALERKWRNDMRSWYDFLHDNNSKYDDNNGNESNDKMHKYTSKWWYSYLERKWRNDMRSWYDFLTTYKISCLLYCQYISLRFLNFRW